MFLLLPCDIKLFCTVSAVNMDLVCMSDQHKIGKIIILKTVSYTHTPGEGPIPPSHDTICDGGERAALTWGLWRDLSPHSAVTLGLWGNTHAL